MTFFSIPSPIIMLFIIWFGHTFVVRGQLQDQDVDENIIAHYGESKIYSRHWLWQKPFSIFKEIVEKKIRFMFIRVKVKTSRIFLYLLS